MNWDIGNNLIYSAICNYVTGRMPLEFYSLERVQAHIEIKENAQKLPVRPGHTGNFLII